MNCSVDSSPRQSSRGLVSKSDFVLPQHNERVTRKKRINDLFCVRFVVLDSWIAKFPQIDKAQTRRNDGFALFLIHSAAIWVRREKVVPDCRAARRSQANFEPLQQSRFAARIARSFRHSFPAGSQFRAQAGAREVAGQAGKASRGRLHRRAEARASLERTPGVDRSWCFGLP